MRHGRADYRRRAAGWSRALLCAILLTIAGPAPAGHAAAGNPFLGARWFVDPDGAARRQADAWRASRPEDAALLDRIAGQPQADWFGDFSGDIRAAVDRRVSRITAAGALPVLVAYNLPRRDCGSHSAAVAGTPEAYRGWIRAFAEGIGSRKAAVILEPDGLAALDCLDETGRRARLAALRDAVGVLRARPGVAVYVDAGHSGWQRAEVMAARLTEAGVAEADGFALNVANYRHTADELAYGRELSARVGSKRFVIDTSRNGQGPAEGPDAWCNPPGRGLGRRPGVSTDDPLLDAYLWIKRPGESDGTCRGGPPAGQWWAEGALELARGAALDPGAVCFAETGYCLRDRFLRHWQERGGLAINGYPISDERAETLEDGRLYLVQYFERVRLEYHPDNAPPYDVLLGQFGRRVLAGVPGAPTMPAPPREGYSYFTVTGHSVSPRFLVHWHEHGGLARFGYPLSEEFVERLEDGREYTVQYFERARFEHHPENAAHYDVLLGQFGRRILAEAGR